MSKIGYLVFAVALIGATVTAAVVPAFERAGELAAPVAEFVKEGEVVLVQPFTGPDAKAAAKVGTEVQQNLTLQLPAGAPAKVRVVAPAKEADKTPAHDLVLTGELSAQSELTLTLSTTTGEQRTRSSALYAPAWSSNTTFWVFWCVLAALGLVVWRVGVFREARAAATVSEHAGDDPFSLLADLQKPLDDLGEELGALTEKATCARVDVLLETYVLPFAEVRRKVIDRLGMGKGSEILVVVAYGERMLNRVWSAASDGHLPEARASYPEARAAFHQAQDLAAAALETIKTSTGGDSTSTSVPAT